MKLIVFRLNYRPPAQPGFLEIMNTHFSELDKNKSANKSTCSAI